MSTIMDNANQDNDANEAIDQVEAVHLRHEYWRLGPASQQTFQQQEDEIEKPITCFVHPKLTPVKLLDFLKSRGASEACILYWMRRLQEVRGTQDASFFHAENAYAVEMMGK